MIYSNFTGRVAKKAKVIDGVNGQFLSMDLAVNDYSKDEEVTQWVRVQSSDPAHLKLAEYFTKGRIRPIQGNVKIDQWESKDGTPHAQLRVHAKYLDFLNIGKKQEGAISNDMRNINSINDYIKDLELLIVDDAEKAYASIAAAWNNSMPRHSSISEIVLNEKFTLPERILLTY